MGPDTTSLRLRLSGPDDTAAFARRLAPRLGAGDTLLLCGPLGSGKSHLARALIQTRLSAAGRVEEVPSPTYTLVQEYADGPLRILHADLYRLSGPEDVIETGLDAAFGSALVLVEWPDRLGALTPPDALTLSLAEAEGGASRVAALTGGPKWRALLADLARSGKGVAA
jgi:tRNA threonylcarbamoyladenosine biosynthesis protein TsaE